MINYVRENLLCCLMTDVCVSLSPHLTLSHGIRDILSHFDPSFTHLISFFIKRQNSSRSLNVFLLG